MVNFGFPWKHITIQSDVALLLLVLTVEGNTHSLGFFRILCVSTEDKIICFCMILIYFHHVLKTLN